MTRTIDAEKRLSASQREARMTAAFAYGKSEIVVTLF
jgi:hypothetical protein